MIWPCSWPFPATTRMSDRKSTRLNSSHLVISYAVFCLKKKKPSESAPAASAARGLHPTCGHTLRRICQLVHCASRCSEQQRVVALRDLCFFFFLNDRPPPEIYPLPPPRLFR